MSVVINDPVLTSTSVNTNESKQDLNLSFDGNVTNISLTFPLLSDVVDLPLSIGNDDVLVCTSDKEPEDQESVLDNVTYIVSDEKALEVIESALTSETLAKYCAAYLSGKHINDQLYDTWKMYKTKCNKANASKSLSVQQLVDELHRLPQETKVQSRKRKLPTSTGFFVITADDVFNEKVQKEEEKKRQLQEKELRKVEREKKKLLKEASGRRKQSKKTKQKKVA